MFGYYANLFAVSFGAIPSSLGSNWLGLLWPAVLVLVGEVIACVYYGWTAMIQKWKSATLIGFASLGVCYTILFVLCGLEKNYQLYSAENSRATRLQAKVDSSDAREKYSVLQAQLQCAKAIGQNEVLATENRTQNDTINNCQNQALQLLKPPEPRVITYGTRLLSVNNSSDPSDTTVVLVGSVTRGYPAFKGRIDCASPFEAKQVLLSKGLFGGNSPLPPGFSKSIPISFLQADWAVGEPLFAVIHGDNLDPANCHIKSE